MMSNKLFMPDENETRQGTKRKFEDEETAQKACVSKHNRKQNFVVEKHKFSANERLKQYRINLQETQQICKVHTLQTISNNTDKANPVISESGSTSITERPRNASHRSSDGDPLQNRNLHDRAIIRSPKQRLTKSDGTLTAERFRNALDRSDDGSILQNRHFRSRTNIGSPKDRIAKSNSALTTKNFRYASYRSGDGDTLQNTHFLNCSAIGFPKNHVAKSDNMQTKERLKNALDRSDNGSTLQNRLFQSNTIIGSSKYYPKTVQEQSESIRSNTNESLGVENSVQKRWLEKENSSCASTSTDHHDCVSPESSMIYDTLHNKSKDEEMDWSPIDDNEVLTNIEQLRQNFDEVVQRHTHFQEIVAKRSEGLITNTSVFKDTFVVIDTNIFLSHLTTVKVLVNTKINAIVHPIIYIPWMVLQELDYIKDGWSPTIKLQKNAQAAVKFINKHLQENSATFKGQSVLEATENKIPNSSPDDEIISCCMQIASKGNQPILLTNDINLQNKALVNNISAFSHDSILKQLYPSEYSPVRFTSQQQQIAKKSEQITTYLSNLFSFVIMDSAKVEFGTYCNKMSLMKDPPWTLPDCLHRFEKLWISVFSGGVHKNFLKAVHDLKNIFSERRRVCTKVDLDELVRCALTCCIYLKKSFSSKYATSVEECINNIKSTVNNL